jgi:hypothetical protein
MGMGARGSSDRPAARRGKSAQGKPPPGARREFQEKSDRKNDRRSDRRSDKKSDRRSDKSILLGSALSGARERPREVYGLRTVKRKPGKHEV